MSDIELLKTKFYALAPHLNERVTRLWAATEAIALGRGGISRVSQATGLSPKTIKAGIIELEQQPASTLKNTWRKERIRVPGGGRKRREDSDPTLIADLEALIDPVSRGHPESPLRWTFKSTAKLATELQARGHTISARKVADLLHQLDYSLQSNRKTRKGASQPDRDAQLQYIHDQVQDFQARGQPVISVDIKKKEPIGNFKNMLAEGQRKKQQVEVNTDDFLDPQLRRVIPYGVYNKAANQGWVNVGIGYDTAELAVESIHQWWQHMGQQMYPDAEELLITADYGGSNSYQLRLWNTELQKLVNQCGLKVQAAHFPPGTSKWNKIEHRMFCQITENWRDKPLTSREVVVNLIGSTTTKQGLTVQAQLNENKYEQGKKIGDEELSQVRLERADFHEEWNYRIIPQKGLNKSQNTEIK